jgi:hypothetical protein
MLEEEKRNPVSSDLGWGEEGPKSMTSRRTEPASETLNPRGTKRRYERPRILSREPLEAVAAVCAPSPPAKSNPGVCPSGPISS